MTSGRWPAPARSPSMPPAAVITLDAGAFEQAGQDATVHRAVVDDQRGQLLPRRQPRIERRSALSISGDPLAAFVRRGNQRQREEEAAALRPARFRRCSSPPIFRSR